jgi:hypothetical protein
MKKSKQEQLDAELEEDMLPEYDLRGRPHVRGKYYELMQQGHSVAILNEDGTETVTHYPPPPPRPPLVVLEPDVEEYFPDSESVNRALRSLIALIPKRKAKKVASPRKKRKLDL